MRPPQLFTQVLCLLLLSFCAAKAAESSAPRSSTLLDAGWKFLQGDALDAERPDCKTAGWQSLTLPHSWGWAEAHQGKAYYRGPGWYRYELKTAPQPEKRYFLRFEAAATVADVWFNGQLLGEHRGGFGAFAFEITTNLSPGGTNVLAVRVSNAPEPDIAPISADFNVYGGLYRPVHLIETAAENFALTDHGSSGVAWLETSVSTNQAVLDVTAEISNNGAHAPKYTLNPGKQSAAGRFVLTARVVDTDGKTVASTAQPIALTAHATAPYSLRVNVLHPHLWNGRADPYLYQAIVELSGTNGVVDAVAQPLGLRSCHVDPDQGFFLNGRPYPIHGVCRHQDRPEKGWAISEADMEEDVQLIKELGATAVRCCHYEQSDYFYRLCDRAGILVWAEIPQVNTINAVDQFEETSRNQLLDLIRQNINHPAIFAWSLFNEIGNGLTDDPHRELQDLNELAHAEDPTRPTIGATSIATWPQMNKIPDLLGWNRYPGWYGPWKGISDAPTYWAEYKDTSRHGGFCMSEYGAGANISQHEENPKPPKTTGPWHPEEYQAMVHEAEWREFKSHPFIWGTFVWNMFDFCVAERHEGGQEALNDKGLVTYNRKIKKDAFYFYQANWSTNPVLYLTSRRFTERTNAVTNVKAYSNAAKVELFLNGKAQGACENDGNAVFIWKDIRLSPGENRIEVRANSKGQNLTDNCTWKLGS